MPAGVELVAVEAAGERRVRSGEPADFEADVDAIARTVVELHERHPFDVLHAQFAYPTGLAALRAAHRVGVPAVVTVQGVDGTGARFLLPDPPASWCGPSSTTPRR